MPAQVAPSANALHLAIRADHGATPHTRNRRPAGARPRFAVMTALI
jgi:hypothetical protein